MRWAYKSKLGKGNEGQTRAWEIALRRLRKWGCFICIAILVLTNRRSIMLQHKILKEDGWREKNLAFLEMERGNLKRHSVKGGEQEQVAERDKLNSGQMS